MPSGVVFFALFASAVAIGLNGIGSSTNLKSDHSHDVLKGDFVPFAGSVKCVIMLVFVYFFFYSGVYFMKMFLDFMKTQRSAALEILQRGTKDVGLAPQLCILFLACRLRAMFMKVEPTEWTQTSMLIAASCVCAQACLTVLMPFVSGEYRFGEDSLGAVEPSRRGIAAGVASLRALITVTMYVFALWVVADIIAMEPPAGTVAPPVAPAVLCTIVLTCAYFIAFIGWDGCKIVGAFVSDNLDGPDGFASSTMKKFSDLMSVGLETMNMAPMLCVLFIATRLRAIALGHDGPQKWAQQGMFATTAAMIVTASLTIIGPMVFGGKINKGLVDGDVTFEMNNYYVGVAFSIVRYVCLFGVYVGLGVVIGSTFMIEPAAGKQALAVATSMQCILILTDIYFLCFLGVWISATVKQMSGDGGSVGNWVNTSILMFDSAKSTTGFIPMVTLLFLAARIRSVRVVGYERAPQNWAQYMMWASTLALTLNAIMSFFQPLTNMGEGESGMGAQILAGLRAFCLLALHAGVVSVIVSMFLINPETAGQLGLANPFKAVANSVSF